jgi:hypothetical protein
MAGAALLTSELGHGLSGLKRTGELQVSKHRTNKKRGVKWALSRLVLQARPAEVVAALAACGISVSQELVRAVALELRRASARADAQRGKARQAISAKPVRRFRRMPAPHGKRCLPSGSSGGNERRCR